MTDRCAASLSFVIPLYNRLDATRRCLESLAATVRGRSGEIVLVDDGSDDGTPELVRGLQEPYRWLCNETNRGFAATVNRGVQASRGPILCLLNNDTVLFDGWLEPMLELLDSAPDVGVVGNVHVDPRRGRIDHAGVFFDLSGHPEHFHRGRKHAPPSSHRERSAASAACWILRRETFLALGGFDECYRNGYEDIDFCLRCRAAGLRILVSHNSRIGHDRAPTPARLEHDEANRRLFLQRWAHVTAGLGRSEWPREYPRQRPPSWWRRNLPRTMHAFWMRTRAGRAARSTAQKCPG